VRFSGKAHIIAQMPDHELWLTDFFDARGNTLSDGREAVESRDAGYVLGFARQRPSLNGGEAGLFATRSAWGSPPWDQNHLAPASV